jgi:hypothetical protein
MNRSVDKPDAAAARAAVAQAKAERRATTRPRRPPRISVEQYNALWNAYRDAPDVKAAAKAAGIKVDVARYYCTGPADAALGFEQLAARLGRLNQAVHRIEDHGVAKFRVEQLDVVGRGLKITEAALAVIQKGMIDLATMVREGKFEPIALLLDKDAGTKLKDIVAAQDKLTRLGLLLQGEADSAPAAHVPGAPRFAEWTAEELAAYAERGVLPERERHGGTA